MILSTLIIIALILISFSIHEFAHAWVANRLGDPTARLDGRLTLNPVAHWDPIGTTLLVGLLFLQGLGIPVFVFGWGKPVPVDERYFSHPKQDSLKTSLAGPGSNFVIAVILALIVRLLPLPTLFTQILVSTISINIFLGIFNLIPIPPLDGSRILQSFLPDESFEQYEQLSPILIMGLLVVLLAFPGLLSSFVDNIITFLLP